MKISVAMATYNGEKYIEEQLVSILNQTVPVDEVVICDDCSVDQTANCIKEFIKKNKLDHSWKFVENEHNLGYAANFIKALRMTEGDLIFFSDQDDIWIPDRIQNMKKVMCEHAEIMLLGSEFEPFSSTEDAPHVHKWELRSFRGDGSLEKIHFDSASIFIGCQGCTMCMRKDLLSKTDAYWYPNWAHDEYLWKLALCMDALYFYHSVTLRRRLHSNNVTLHTEHEKVQRMKYLEDLLKSHEKTWQFLKENEAAKWKIDLLEKHISATQMRISLIGERKILNALALILKYADCYHKKRSIPVEFMIAVRGK